MRDAGLGSDGMGGHFLPLSHGRERWLLGSIEWSG
jgi:hypothetical protein